jgi:hypothetical protein
MFYFSYGVAGSAIGFKLDSLLKLSDTRARNNKMTLMHYLCKVEILKLSTKCLCYVKITLSRKKQQKPSHTHDTKPFHSPPNIMPRGKDFKHIPATLSLSEFRAHLLVTSYNRGIVYCTLLQFPLTIYHQLSFMGCMRQFELYTILI